MVTLFGWHGYGCGPFAHFIMFPELLFRVPLWWVSHIWWFISSKYAWLLLTWARCTFSLDSDLMEQSFHQHVSQLGSKSVKIFQKVSLFPLALVSFCTFFSTHHPSLWNMCEIPFIYKNNGSDYIWIYQMAFGKSVSTQRKILLLHNSWDLTGGHLENGKLTELSVKFH